MLAAICIQEEKLPDPSILRLMKMNAGEWYYIVIGCIMALAQGAVQPAYGLVFGFVFGVSYFLFLTDVYEALRS